LSIQARTGDVSGLRDVLNRCFNDLGLAMIDHRSWHPRSLNATVVTEIYVEDTRTLLTVPMPDEDIEKGTKKSESISIEHESENGLNGKTRSARSEASPIKVQSDAQAENKLVAARCEEVRQAILNTLGDDEQVAFVEVTEWKPAACMRSHVKSAVQDSGENIVKLSVKEQAQRQLKFKEMIDSNLYATGTAAAHLSKHTNDVRGSLFRIPDSGNIETQALVTTPQSVSEPSSSATTMYSSLVAAQGAGADIRTSHGSGAYSNIMIRCPLKRQLSAPNVVNHCLWDTVVSQKVLRQAALEND